MLLEEGSTSTSSSGGSGTRSPGARLPDLPDDREALSLIEGNIRSRLLRQNLGNEIILFDEDLELRIKLKLAILKEIQGLNPEDTFWVSQQTQIISEGLTNRLGNEFDLETLLHKLTDVQMRGTDSSVYKHVFRYKENFEMSGGRWLDRF